MKYIKTSLNNFISEKRFQINNLPSNIVLLTSNLNGEGGLFMLYDTKNQNPIGYISFSYYDTIRSYTVGGAYSKHGYGPFLYEIVMTQVYPHGLSMSRDSTTSDDALNVWRKFLKRSDVKNERIKSEEITHKKEDWLSSGFLDDEPEYRQTIFDLEDTRFYYNFGKEKLNKMIEDGKKYADDNNLSEKSIEYLSWDLEN